MAEAEDINTQLAALEAQDLQDFAALLQQHANARDMEARACRLKESLVEQIKAKMTAEGMKTVKAGGQRATLSERSYYGFNKGDTPEEQAKNLADLKAFFDQYAPDLNVPATTNIAKAVEAFFAATGQQELPAFIKKNDTITLTNAKG